MKFPELSNDQRRQLVDAQQAFKVWREADQEFRHGYPPLYKGFRATMRWKPVTGKEYLYRGDKSLGPAHQKPNASRLTTQTNARNYVLEPGADKRLANILKKALNTPPKRDATAKTGKRNSDRS